MVLSHLNFPLTVRDGTELKIKQKYKRINIGESPVTRTSDQVSAKPGSAKKAFLNNAGF
jgi:hypothetical protein